ncbi:MAG: type II toxin-antitoxin system RelE/ParE family toxin [Deltaproteobacteria bacterium]|nr:type II toxin-antitoxin system RelE/ParE family toxin [Deltaproteobacteria bacterium]
MNIVFTPSARRHFLEVLEYIRRDDPKAARRFRDKAKSVLSRLADFPESGRAIPEFLGLPHREVIVRSYRFFYRIVDQTVWIVAVWHSAQLPADPKN